MVASFPFANGLIETCFEVFRGSSKTLLQFVPLIFVVRIILIKATFGGSHDYRELLKEVLYLYVGFFVFQEIMEFVMSTPDMAAQIIKKPKAFDMQGKSSWISMVLKLDGEDIINIISSGVYWIVCFCYLILMGFMITVGAYIILFSSILKMRWMIKAYMSVVLILSLWPFVWYTVDQAFVFAIKGLENSNNGTGTIIAMLVGALLKVSVPMIGLLAAMKAPVAGAISAFNSLREGGKPFAGATKLAYGGVKKAGKAIGADTAIESFRQDPEIKEAKRQEKIANRKFHINDVAPYAAYSVQKAFKKLPDSKKQSSDAYGQTQTQKKKVDFKEFKENNVVQLDKRRNIKSQQAIHKKSQFNQSSKASSFQESRSFKNSEQHVSQTTDVRQKNQIDRAKNFEHTENHKISKEKSYYLKTNEQRSKTQTYTEKSFKYKENDFRGKL